MKNPAGHRRLLAALLLLRSSSALAFGTGSAPLFSRRGVGTRTTPTSSVRRRHASAIHHPSRPRRPSPGRASAASPAASSLRSAGDDYDDAPSSRRVPRDVVIVGGGLASLSVALHVATRSDRRVTVLERETPEEQRRKTTAGSFAAAGMLAPQSERLPAGPLLDICLESRGMYGGWIRDVERGAREASLGAPTGRGRRRGGRRGRKLTGEGARYLWDVPGDGGDEGGEDDASSPLEPWETGFHSTGGFLAPAFAGDAVATWSPQPDSGRSYWLDDVQVRELEPNLHPDVVGGWWFPEDASVDARRLTCSLRAACAGAGVELRFGPEAEVTSLEMSGGTCTGVHLADGRTYKARAVVVANGSWMREILPLPVTPHKGQSFSLRMPEGGGGAPMLSRVLFAQDTYIVPKADGRIIVGATVEPGRYDGDVTPEGLLHCLSEATRLVPGLAELPIEETWAGLRPTTPDKCPVLGRTEQFDNVYLAGGYWRNGVLLAPKTGQLVGGLIMRDGDVASMSESDRRLLGAFSWDRFTSPDGGGKLAADSRYAATFYPVHKRSTSGVAAAVGTELGFYEGASAAKGDRARDRRAMFGISEDEEEALERAAGMGVGDAKAFTFGDEGDGWKVRKPGSEEEEEEEEEEGGPAESIWADAGAPAAESVSDESVSDESGEDEDISSVYERIRANKAKAAGSIVMGDGASDDGGRPDPGFRIYHQDPSSGKTYEVPPYTSPAEFFRMKDEGSLSDGATSPPPESDGDAGDSEPAGASSRDDETATAAATTTTTVDGDTAIREAYGEGATEEETAEATRRARMSNRIKASEIDEARIGAAAMSPSPVPPGEAAAGGDLEDAYERIRRNKASASSSVEMSEYSGDERPELPFTIYHVDSKTREVREVPQYTSPGEFFDMIDRGEVSVEEDLSEEQEGSVVVNGGDGESEEGPVVAVTNGSAEAESAEPSRAPILNGDTELEDVIDDGSDEKTYDGYQAILAANGSTSREEELSRMREARMRNRSKEGGGGLESSALQSFE